MSRKSRTDYADHTDYDSRTSCMSRNDRTSRTNRMSRTNDAPKTNSLLRGAFSKYLCLSVLITLSATLGMMIDNVIAGNLLGPDAVAAIGMSLPVFMLFSGFAGIIETGAVALSARAMGTRDASRVNMLFSVSLLAALVAGAVLSVCCTAFSSDIATFMGAREGDLHANTTAFLSGICTGALPILVLQLLMGFLRLDNAPQLGIIAIIIMSVCDVSLNLAAVCVLDAGLHGMGLATASSYCIAVVICCTHFFFKKNTLHLVNPLTHLKELGGILKTGLPDSLTRVTVMLRTFAFNHLLLAVAAGEAVAVLSMLSSVNTFTSSLSIGLGQTATLMCGIFYGEEDKLALKNTLRIAIRMGIVMTVILVIAVCAFAPAVVGLFGFTGAELALGVIAVRIFITREPFSILNQVFSSYFQASGNVSGASALAVCEAGLVGMLFALCGVWALGVNAIWLSFPIGSVITLALQLVFARFGKVRKAESKGATHTDFLEKMMHFPASFQSTWVASENFECEPTLAGATDCANMVGEWCISRGIDNRRAYLATLGTEELVTNTVKHGFSRIKKPAIDVRITLKQDDILELHVRDNAHPFNPVNFDTTSSASNSKEAIGIHTLRNAIKNVEYQNTVGLNNTTITLSAD